jgi:hypothetical protein
MLPEPANNIDCLTNVEGGIIELQAVDSCPLLLRGEQFCNRASTADVLDCGKSKTYEDLRMAHLYHLYLGDILGLDDHVACRPIS